MPCQRGCLVLGRVQREPERLHAPAVGDLQPRLPAAAASSDAGAASARLAGCCAARLPHSRANIDVRISVPFHTKSSDLGRIDHRQLTALRGNRGADVLRAEPAETASVFHHDPTHNPVTPRSEELTALPRGRGTDLDNNPADTVQFRPGRHTHPRQLPIQVGPLIRSGHPRLLRRPRRQGSYVDRLVHQNQPTTFRARPANTPAPNQRYAVTRPKPFRSTHPGQTHAPVPTTRHRQPPTTRHTTATTPTSVPAVDARAALTRRG
jgi:hypothetical protein